VLHPQSEPTNPFDYCPTWNTYYYWNSYCTADSFGSGMLFQRARFSIDTWEHCWPRRKAKHECGRGAKGYSATGVLSRFGVTLYDGGYCFHNRNLPFFQLCSLIVNLWICVIKHHLHTSF